MEFTQETLLDALQAFNEDDSEEFVDNLPTIVRLGEARLAKRLDLDSLDGIDTVETVTDSTEITKPDDLVVERLLVLSGADSKTVVHRRTRAWVELYNADGEIGTPKYYCDLDDERWLVAPAAAQVLEISVHGLYRPVSIMDGAATGTTWFSTRVPELLLLACSIDALEFLKFWSKKSAQEADFEAQASAWLKIAAPLQRVDVEDILGSRQNVNKPDTQAG